MFTGIIEECGTLKSVKKLSGRNVYTIVCSKVLTDTKVGDSICSNGICLTIIDKSTDWFQAEVMHETILKTTARFWKAGDRINLERSMSANGRFDGHIVQGHVDTSAKIVERYVVNKAVYLGISVPDVHKSLIVPQGSITVNGVSLTIAELTGYGLKVAIIGHTLEETNITDLKIGEKVNIEFDIVGKYIQRFNLLKSSKVTEEWLIEQGF